MGPNLKSPLPRADKVRMPIRHVQVIEPFVVAAVEYLLDCQPLSFVAG